MSMRQKIELGAAQMKRVQLGMLAGQIAACVAAVTITQAAFAQVYATTPNGQMGYISTPNPVSPNCTAPYVWTAYNGHYMCAVPPPQCQYGYASAPVLNGNGSWSYSCDGPPAPPTPPVGDPVNVTVV